MNDAVVLLIFYLTLALGVSCLCSMCEAAILTISPAYAHMLARQGRRYGRALERMKRDIDRPLAAILTLNTCAHTIGAAGVGAQAFIIFGEGSVAIVSAVLTLLILVLSEIIPKTLGAVYARPLIGPVTRIIQGMIWISWPLVISLDFMSRLLKSRGGGETLSREQIAVIADLGRSEGAIRASEAELIQSLLRLNETPVSKVMTPRTVVFMVERTETADAVAAEPRFRQFTRIPIYNETPDDMLGFVVKSDIYEAIRAGRGDQPVGDMARPFFVVPETAPLLRVFEQFGSRGDHIFLVVDEYGGTAGIVTLEDVLESVIGAEIVDETDRVADMRRLAHRGRSNTQSASPG